MSSKLVFGAAFLLGGDQIVRNDRYFHGPRVRVLRDILGKLRPEPARPTAAPLRNYEPPSRGDIGDGGRTGSFDSCAWIIRQPKEPRRIQARTNVDVEH